MAKAKAPAKKATAEVAKQKRRPRKKEAPAKEASFQGVLGGIKGGLK